MDKAGLPDQTSTQASAHVPLGANFGGANSGGNSGADEIPIAFRETPAIASPPAANRVSLLVAATAAGLLALAGGALLSLQLQRSQPPVAVATAPAAAPAATPAAPVSDRMLGHFPYAEAPLADLDSITTDGSIKMRKAAAQAFKEMAQAAARDGVILSPISGFRSKADQQQLYFGVKEERNQSPAERAKVSAPPGYSEHHTGYAVDLGDGNVPAVNLDPAFDKTPAYQWLAANANRFSFEISFPKNNAQGVTYEPWHWRYVGDSQSLETFYKARK